MAAKSIVSLAQVWAAPAEALVPVLTRDKLTPSGNLRLDRLRTATLYYNRGELNPADYVWIQNPNFNTVMKAVDTLEEGQALLNPAPVEADVSGNAGLKAHFERLAELTAASDEKGAEYKVKSFERAALAVGQAAEPITSGEQLRILMGLKTKKSSTIDEANEYLTTGSSKRRRELEAKAGTPASVDKAPSQDEIKRQQTLELFEGVYGIGPKTAPKFYEQGYRTLEDLSRAPLNDKQAIGLKWYYHFKERIPRSEMDEYVVRLKTLLAPGNEWLISGSYRRLGSSSGDVDVLMRNDTKTDMPAIVAGLVKSGLVLDELASGPHKFMGAVSLGPGRVTRRLDIRLFEPNVFAYALLYNTGSQRFNILCRQRCIDLGLHLNEYGITYQGASVARAHMSAEEISHPAATEEDIFRWMGVKYLRPEERTNDLVALTPE